MLWLGGIFGQILTEWSHKSFELFKLRFPVVQSILSTCQFRLQLIVFITPKYFVKYVCPINYWVEGQSWADTDKSSDMSLCPSPCPKQTRTRTRNFLRLRTRIRTRTRDFPRLRTRIRTRTRTKSALRTRVRTRTRTWTRTLINRRTQASTYGLSCSVRPSMPRTKKISCSEEKTLLRRPAPFIEWTVLIRSSFTNHRPDNRLVWRQNPSITWTVLQDIKRLGQWTDGPPTYDD